MLDKNSLEHHIRLHIKSTNGVDFEKLFWKICKSNFPDLAILKPYHDIGNDGYSLKEKIFFSCYGVENKYQNSYTIKKVKQEYKKFTTNWLDKNIFKKWVFVTNDNLMGAPHQTILDLNKVKDGVLKENWGLDELVYFTKELKEQPLHTIFKLPEHNLYSSNQSIKLWTGKKKDDTLNIDNLVTLKYSWNDIKQGNIELAINAFSFEDEKPEGGSTIGSGNIKLKIGDHINKGQGEMRNLVLNLSNEIVKFDSSGNRNKLIKIGNRSFSVSLNSIKKVDKGKGPRSYEYNFSISENKIQ